MSTRSISWGKRRPVRKADNLTAILSWNLGTSTSWNPLGHSRLVTGLLLLLYKMTGHRVHCVDFHSNVFSLSLTSTYLLTLITLNDTHIHTFGRTPLNQGSARRRDLYLTVLYTLKRQTTMPSAGFEPMIRLSELPKTYALECEATEIGSANIWQVWYLKHQDRAAIVICTDEFTEFPLQGYFCRF